MPTLPAMFESNVDFLTESTASASVDLSAEQLNELLLQARQAREQLQLGRGLALAKQVWRAADDQGYLAEQIEAGYLRAFFLVRQGAQTELLAAAEAVLPLMREQGPSENLCELLRWTTIAGFDSGDFEQCMRDAHEACSVAQRLGQARQISLSLNALAAVFERMGDPWQAERLMGEAAALVRDGSHPFERMVSMNNLCAVILAAHQLLRDGNREQQAQQALQRGLEYAAEASQLAQAGNDLYFKVATAANRVDLLLRADRGDEAESLLLPALALAQEHQLTSQCCDLSCSQTELTLMRGQTERAWAQAQDLVAQMSAASSKAMVLRMYELAYRCAKAMNLSDQALHFLELQHRLERECTTLQLEAQSRFFVTRLEAEQARLQVTATPGAGGTAVPNPASAVASHIDPLTGLHNRRHLESTMPGLMRLAESREAPLTLALIDVDHLKQVNTEFGYAAGDQVLTHLADMLRDNTRASDLLVRMEGEEFLVVFPDTVADRAFEVCERLREHVENHPWHEVAPGLHVTLSVGLASAPPYGTDLLTSRAQSAMQRAKHLGMNRVALA